MSDVAVTKISKCTLGEHKDVYVRGGKRLKCTLCGDTFPCSYKCEHVDCCSIRGDELPDWVKGETLTLEDVLKV